MVRTITIRRTIKVPVKIRVNTQSALEHSRRKPPAGGLGPVHTNESKCFIIVGWNSQKLNTNASPPICPSNAAT